MCCWTPPAYIDMAGGDNAVAEVLSEARQVYLCITVLGELLAGFTLNPRGEAGRATFEAFMKARRVEMLYPDQTTAAQYASLYNHAKQRGRMMPTNDLWIAAIAVQYKLTVITRDPHFAELPISSCVVD